MISFNTTTLVLLSASPKIKVSWPETPLFGVYSKTKGCKLFTTPFVPFCNSVKPIEGNKIACFLVFFNVNLNVSLALNEVSSLIIWIKPFATDPTPSLTEYCTYPFDTLESMMNLTSPPFIFACPPSTLPNPTRLRLPVEEKSLINGRILIVSLTVTDV